MKITHDKQKVHSLTGRITTKLMHEAFKAVKKNRGAAGIDKISIKAFERDLEGNLSKLMNELKKGTYKPIPLKRVHIPKGNGKTRPLGIPSVRCRIAQEVVRRLINPIFDCQFHDNSYGFRPGRSCHQAVECVELYIQQGYTYIVDADIKGFFDNIPLRVIVESAEAKIADGNILSLIEKFLTSGVMEEGEFRPTTKGTPQGGVISCLLSNMVLDHLDKQLDEKGYKFVRYADDFVILCKDQKQAEKALEDAQSFLNELGLELSQEKTHITRAKDGFDFLGFEINSWGAKMRKKSVEKFKTKVKEITIRCHNLDQKVVEKLNQVIRGTVNYFCTRTTNVIGQFRKLDKGIRKRIRCMKYKRISHYDNSRFRNKHITKKLGVLNCIELCRMRLRY